MSTWLIALIPIFSLTIVFVFGFVGCALEKSGLPGGPSDGGDGGPTTKYTDVIVADKPLAYWRLGEFEGPTAAADQIGVDAAHPTGLHPGTYHSGTPIPAAPDSSPAPGTLSFGSPGLLTSDPAHSVDFDGGYAEIAHNG